MPTRRLEILESLPEQPTDANLSEATDQLYKQAMALQEWQQELQEGRQTLREVQDILGCYTIDLSDEEMRERFKARRGHVSIDVLPAQFVEEAYKLKEQGEGWKLPELLVPVPIYWLRQREFFTFLSDLGYIQTTLKYNAEYGLLLEEDSCDSSDTVIL